MSNTLIDSAKDALRDEMRSLRRGLHDSRGVASAEAAAGHGKQFLDGFSRDKVIAGYNPIATELDVRFLMRDLEAAGFSLAMPAVVTTGGAMVFRRYGMGDPLIEGPHGTMHPGDDAPEVRPDIILCPLLAYDARGYRLGYGRGYYDRTLEAHPEARAFGFAYSAQMADRVPHTDADRPVDAVISETGTFICAATQNIAEA